MPLARGIETQNRALLHPPQKHPKNTPKTPQKHPKNTPKTPQKHPILYPPKNPKNPSKSLLKPQKRGQKTPKKGSKNTPKTPQNPQTPKPLHKSTMKYKLIIQNTIYKVPRYNHRLRSELGSRVALGPCNFSCHGCAPRSSFSYQVAIGDPASISPADALGLGVEVMDWETTFLGPSTLGRWLAVPFYSMLGNCTDFFFPILDDEAHTCPDGCWVLPPFMRFFCLALLCLFIMFGSKSSASCIRSMFNISIPCYVGLNSDILNFSCLPEAIGVVTMSWFVGVCERDR